MAKSPDLTRDAEAAHLQTALDRFRDPIISEMRAFFTAHDADADLHSFYGPMAYHLGWVDERFAPAQNPPGKLMRPALVLWACELAALAVGADATTRAERLYGALPAAVSVELIHNFSLIHDDIEDCDRLRRGRPTIWAIWGEPQAINIGDGMFALARLALVDCATRGVAAPLVLGMAGELDRTSLRLCEGQHRDMGFEGTTVVTPTMYLDMIARKTAALMRAACSFGATIGAAGVPGIVRDLAEFGECLGVAFQLRDDLLGIWDAHTSLGKTAAGDLRRRKKSLPVIHALAHAPPTKRARLAAIYAAETEPTEADITWMLTVIGATSRAWCREQLAELCARARTALAHACGAHAGVADSESAQALGALVDYIALAASPAE
ncbi:MAG: polyprenyl synthetase family protein [Ktedonobacterales bacterium]|nr:polyprenyl synthetase family protein [Ktedonobacterales bacterium]